MIPITKELDNEEQKEYIEKVIRIIPVKHLKPFITHLQKVYKYIRINNNGLYKNMISFSLQWHKSNPGYEITRNHYHKTNTVKNPLLFSWLVMSFDYLKDIKCELDDMKKKYWTTLESDTNHWKAVYREYSANDINKWIVEASTVKVCPYCNLAYTYNRTKKRTNAQLDHFYDKDHYSILALSYYNLVPSCSACNNIKTNSIDRIISPYEKDAYKDIKINWKFKVNESRKLSLGDLAQNIDIIFKPDIEDKKRHIKLMKIDEAYQQHTDYAAEIIKRTQIYHNSAMRLLINKAIKSWKITDDELERFYFGNYTKAEEQGNRVLAKLTVDFIEQSKNKSKK